MPALEQLVGQRLRWHRTRRGKSQAVVAGLAGLHPEYLGQVERGHRVPSLQTVEALAKALGIPVAELLADSPARSETPRTELGSQLHRTLMLPDPAGQGEKVETAGLPQRVASAWSTWQSSTDRYSRLTELIVGLVGEIRRSSENGVADEEAHRTASEGYFLLRTVTRRISRPDLALIAADRGRTTANHSGSPVHVAGAHWNVAHALLAQGEPEAAEDVALSTISMIENRPDDSRELTALSGALWLTAAVAASRSGRVWVARQRVREQAAAAAARTGETNVLWTAFGPTNVALHAMHIELEDGDAASALRIADAVDPSPLPSRERHTTFFLDVARCHHQRQDEGAAIVHLLTAERTSPEELRYNPVAHDVVRGVLKRARRSLAPQVHRLAERIGLTE